MTAYVQIVDNAIEGEVFIPTTPERVFAALTSPEELMAWWGSSETYSIITAEVNREQGGLWKIEAEDTGGRRFAVSAIICAIQPPNRLHLKWATSWAPEDQSDVEITLSSKGDGTLLRLRHSGLGGAGTAGRETHYWAWRSILGWLRDRF